MIKAIFIAEQAESVQSSLHCAELKAGMGIVGDRNFARHNCKGQNITFVALEQITQFNAQFKQSAQIDATRRNIVTEGIDLNALVGKCFSIGGVRFRGVELCEPCAKLGDRLKGDTVSRAQAVRAFVHRGGLRADVLNDGVISVGMAIEVDNGSDS